MQIFTYFYNSFLHGCANRFITDGEGNGVSSVVSIGITDILSYFWGCVIAEVPDISKKVVVWVGCCCIERSWYSFKGVGRNFYLCDGGSDFFYGYDYLCFLGDNAIAICNLISDRSLISKLRKIDGEAEAHLIAMACSQAPTGYRGWTLRLLAEQMVVLRYVESISHESLSR